MAINLAEFWARNFREGISDRAAKVRTEADHTHWTKESRDWMTYVVETEARRLKMSDEDRRLLADSCVRHFNEIDAQVCTRLYAAVASEMRRET